MTTVIVHVIGHFSPQNEFPQWEGHVHKQEDDSYLSAREKEVLVCVAKGMINKEIADHLNISIHTVISHRKNISQKTGIKTVAGMTVYALLNKLIDIPGTIT